MSLDNGSKPSTDTIKFLVDNEVRYFINSQ